MRFASFLVVIAAFTNHAHAGVVFIDSFRDSSFLIDFTADGVPVTADTSLTDGGMRKESVNLTSGVNAFLNVATEAASIAQGAVSQAEIGLRYEFDSARDLTDLGTNDVIALDFRSAENGLLFENFIITVNDSVSVDFGSVGNNSINDQLGLTSGSLTSNQFLASFDSFSGVDFTAISTVEIAALGTQEKEFQFDFVSAQSSSAPEPSSLCLVLPLGMGMALRRKRKRT